MWVPWEYEEGATAPVVGRTILWEAVTGETSIILAMIVEAPAWIY
jgi:hypothetical protein